VEREETEETIAIKPLLRLLYDASYEGTMKETYRAGCRQAGRGVSLSILREIPLLSLRRG
jgi:hypothetical protein